MAAEVLVDITLKCVDLVVVRGDQVTQRPNTTRERLGELELIELATSAGAEHVSVSRQHTLFGHDRMDLRLEPAAELHELGSIAHQLTQLPQRRRRDPRLRQTMQP